MNSELEEIRARIGTARLLLDRLAGDHTELASASRTQCTALVDTALRAKNFDEADKAALAELAQNVRWEASGAATVARTFVGNDAASDMATGGCSRQPLQDLEHLHNLFLRASGPTL